MKISSRGTEVEIYGAETEERVFAIQTSAIAFATLSSKLYSDTTTAIIRELSCNAWDAHVEVNKQKKPFEINLPTQLRPEFIIRDFGPGMDDEQVMSLYCTYFASSKQGTNKQIGGFGIGSKSPFSYTDGFTVISRQKGEKRTYSAYINESRVPAVVRLSTETTDEENGLEVKFPVKATDFYEFETKATQVLEFFDPVPIVNRLNFKPRKQEYLLEGKKWKLRKEQHNTGVRVVQGKVPYKVQGFEDVELTTEAQAVLEMPIDIFLPIGTLSPAATRESLTNDKVTIEKAGQILGEVYADIKAALEERAKTFTTGWDKLTYFHSLRDLPGLADMISSLRAELVKDANLFGGQRIQQTDYPQLFLRKYTRTWDGTSSEDLFSRDMSKAKHLSLLSNSGPFSSEQSLTTEFVVVDKHSGGDRQIRDYLKTKAYGMNIKTPPIIAILPMNPTVKAEDFDATEFMAETLKLISALGSPKWAALSSLDIPTPKPKSRECTDSTVHRSWTWRGNTSTYSNAWQASTDPRPRDGVHYYIRSLRSKVCGLNENKIDTPRDVDKVLVAISNLPFVDFKITDRVFAFGEKELLPSRTKATWINLFDHAEAKALEYISNPDNLSIVYNNEGELAATAGVHWLSAATDAKELSPSSLFSKACAFYRREDVDSKQGVQSQIEAFFQSLASKDSLAKLNSLLVHDGTTIPEMVEGLRNQYPLIKDKTSPDLSLAFFYIKAIDKQAEEAELETMYEGSELVGM